MRINAAKTDIKLFEALLQERAATLQCHEIVKRAQQTVHDNYNSHSHHSEDGKAVTSRFPASDDGSSHCNTANKREVCSSAENQRVGPNEVVGDHRVMEIRYLRGY